MGHDNGRENGRDNARENPRENIRETGRESGRESNNAAYDTAKAPSSGKDLRKLFIVNLPVDSDEKEISSLLADQGLKADDIYLPRTAQNTLKGFGYVKFLGESEARQALKELNGLKLRGKAIRVDFADLRKNQ